MEQEHLLTAYDVADRLVVLDKLSRNELVAVAGISYDKETLKHRIANSDTICSQITITLKYHEPIS